MFTVIDTIKYSPSWLRHHPDLMKDFGEGLLVILDFNEIQEDPNIVNHPVLIHKSNGQKLNLTVARSLKRSVVALFFAGLSDIDIPIGAKVSW